MKSLIYVSEIKVNKRVMRSEDEERHRPEKPCSKCDAGERRAHVHALPRRLLGLYPGVREGRQALPHGETQDDP